jgi:HK97 family phage prohead protease
MESVKCKGLISLKVKAKSFKQLDGDFQDVQISGYASTQTIDRDGEYFVSGAWNTAISKFMAGNPILLIDHSQRIENIIGQVTLLEERDKGLYMEASITNDPAFSSLRFRIKEGLINAVSVSGRWSYDGPAIKQVTDLYEISLVAVPANPDALISAKSFERDNLKDETYQTFQFKIK